MPLSPEARDRILAQLSRIETSLSNMQHAMVSTFEDFTSEPRIEEVLEDAAAGNLVVTFDYLKPESDGYETRVVRVEDFAEARRPDSRFYWIRGYDYDRQGYRTFRLPRMRQSSIKVAR